MIGFESVTHAPMTASTPALSGRSIVQAALDEMGITGAMIEEQLEGGASTRQFFRVRWGTQNAIAMYTPAPSQEIAKARQASGYAAFVEVAQLLTDRALPVPKILGASQIAPVLLVEDLGNHTLANYLTLHPERKEALYRLAVTTLARAQTHLSPVPAGSVVETRSFDYDLLQWEVEHFRQWALCARGIQLNDRDDRTFTEAAHYLASTISSWDKGFVHRDYQSRNIMVRGAHGAETLTWIDFQDAMLGPRVYDLVALLTDSYQTFSPEFVEARLDEYCELRGCIGERALIRDEFFLVTVQRKLKDAGRFVFLERVNQNSHFLQFVEPTIDKARRALQQVKSLGPLDRLDELLTRLMGPL